MTPQMDYKLDLQALGGAEGEAEGRHQGELAWRTFSESMLALLPFHWRHPHCTMVNVPPLAVRRLRPCASSARAWRLWAARYSQSEAQPLGAQPPPRGPKRAASKVADFAAFKTL